MRRLKLQPRNGWQARVEALGLVWHSAPGGRPYWNESAAYAFTPAQAARIEDATAELYRLFVIAAEHVIRHDRFERFALPDWTIPLIRRAWDAEPPCLNHGRFDLGYDGTGHPKLFAFNCDTPTALLEAAVVQWAWKDDVFPDRDQFNSLHERLVARWREIAPRLVTPVVHLVHQQDPSGEDAVTVAYLADTAREAGLAPRVLAIEDIGWDRTRRAFVDLDGRTIDTVFKLYPWEWLVQDSFAQYLPEARTLWMEPIWKMLWSNKAILPILWELFPAHPNLLPAHFERRTDSYVEKPILAREGANVRVVRNGQVLAQSAGGYGGGPSVFQGLYELPDFDGARPVIGSWVVDGAPAGIGVREDGLITGNTASFAPHVLMA